MSVRPSPGVVTRQCIVRQTGEWTDTHTDWRTDKLQLYLMGNFETIKPMVVSEVHKITSQKNREIHGNLLILSNSHSETDM